MLFTTWGEIISVLLFIIIQDFVFYGYHRLMHTKSLYSKFHYVHHSNKVPNSWCANISHKLDSNLESLIFILPGLIVPLNYKLLHTLVLITQIWKNIIHESKLRFKLKYINNPCNHLVHHQFENYNYGFWTTIPDRLFRTEFVY